MTIKWFLQLNWGQGVDNELILKAHLVVRANKTAVCNIVFWQFLMIVNHFLCFKNWSQTSAKQVVEIQDESLIITHLVTCLITTFVITTMFVFFLRSEISSNGAINEIILIFLGRELWMEIAIHSSSSDNESEISLLSTMICETK